MSAWTPAQLGASVYTWLDLSSPAETINTSVNYPQFSGVPDRGPNGNPGSTLPESSQGSNNYSAPFAQVPAGTPVRINGLQAASFGGVQEIYQGGVNYTGTNQITVAFVATLNAATVGNGRIFSARSPNGNTDYNTPGTFDICRGGGGQALSLNFVCNYGVSASFPAYGTPFLSFIKADVSNIYLSINGGQAVSSPASTAFDMTKFSWGYSALASGENWNGLLGEAMVISTALASASQAKLEGYLAWKWGLQGSLPANHPYAAAAPSTSNAYSSTLAAAGAGSGFLLGHPTESGFFVASGLGKVGMAPTRTSPGLVMAMGLGSSSVASTAQSSGLAMGTGLGSSGVAPTRTSPGLVMAMGLGSSSVAPTRGARGLMVARGLGSSGVAPRRSVQESAISAGSSAAQLLGSRASPAHLAASGAAGAVLLGHPILGGHVLAGGAGASHLASARYAYGGQIAALGDAFVLLHPSLRYRALPVSAFGAGSSAAVLANAVKSRKRVARTLVSVPASAPSWANGMVAQINALFRSTPEPTSPGQLYEAATPSDLPAPGDYPMCLAWVDSLAAVVVSNGSAWLQLQLGSKA